MGGGAGVGRAIALAAAAAGAGLLYLAVPIAVAGLAETPGHATLKRLYHETPGAPALQRLVRSREASLRWRETGRAATDLALARMMLAEGLTGAERAGQIALAAEALVRGLGLAPMSPHGWMRLAWVGMAQLRPAGEVAPVLSLAVHTGPREERMFPLAAQAGLHAWSSLDPGDRDLVADRIRRAWRTDALGTAAAAARLGQTALLARLVLRSRSPLDAGAANRAMPPGSPGAGSPPPGEPGS